MRNPILQLSARRTRQREKGNRENPGTGEGIQAPHQSVERHEPAH